jgi:hypothetical protein
MIRFAPWLLLLLTALPAAATAAADPLGKLAWTGGEKKVKGGTGQQRIEDMPDMAVRQPVEAGMEVATVGRSVAKIALEGKSPQGKKTCVGAVTLGPESRFRFGETLPQPGWFNFRLNAGSLRAAFAPTLNDQDDQEAQALLGVEPHVVQIDTPNAHIDVHGSDIYVWFDPETGITRVYVQEGRADVRARNARVESSSTVHAAAGEMTEVKDGGGPPTPPRRLPGRLPEVFPMTGDLLFQDPFLDLKNPGLDLPK